MQPRDLRRAKPNGTRTSRGVRTIRTTMLTADGYFPTLYLREGTEDGLIPVWHTRSRVYGDALPMMGGPAAPQPYVQQSAQPGYVPGQPQLSAAQVKQNETVAKWNAIGAVGSALAQMGGMIGVTIAGNRGQEKLIQAQARADKMAAPGQALIYEKQSLLTSAQAALADAQNQYIWPVAMVGAIAVAGVVGYILLDKQDKNKRANA